MAGQDNLLSRITALIAGFDDASWEALASKGLLRRARKDMEKALAIEVSRETSDALEIKVPPFVVSIPPSGPAKATCNCPAPGICQHILAAGLYLQAQSLAPGKTASRLTADSIREEVTSFTSELLRSWAGSADYKAGFSLLERNSMPPIIEYQETVLIRLMPSSVEVRFVSAGGLDGMVLPKPHGKRAGVAAVMALRQSLGLEVPTAEVQRSLLELTGTPRTKKEILASACAVLEDAVTVGLSHLSPATADRLMTLAVSAQGANLPRVALALKTISDEVRSLVEREARADESRLLLTAARCYALMEALGGEGESPRVELAGEHRARYVDVPEIELSGVGAYTWRTGSGYSGLTVLFWSNQSQEFLSWAEARPATQQFDARQRFYGEGPWDGTQSPQQIASSTLKLRNARRTVNGRLSGSGKTTAIVLGPTTPVALNFGARVFTSWQRLGHHVHERQPLGLREPNPLDLIGILQPSAFGLRTFDSITQTLTWEVYDEQGQVLTLSLPFREWNKEAIQVLEKLKPPAASPWRVLTRLALHDDALSLEPVSIFRTEDPSNPIFHLAFDVVRRQDSRKSASRQKLEREPEPDEESFEEEASEFDETSISSRTSLSRTIAELNQHLEAIAETGSGHRLEDHGQWLENFGKDCHTLGLTCLASALQTLGKDSPTPARALLQARYLSYLHGQAVPRAAASS
jgi:hypothetical protein